MSRIRTATSILARAAFLAALLPARPAHGWSWPAEDAVANGAPGGGSTRQLAFVPVRGGTLTRSATGRGYLGLELQQSSTSGILVMAVKEDGPAYGSGILSGDVIVALGDTRIAEYRQLTEFMEQETLPAMVLTVTVLRQRVEHRFPVTLAHPPGSSAATPATVVADFLLGAHEVTQAQWEAVMGSSPSLFAGPDRPVESVSHTQVLAFIERLNAMTGLRYRLPTEAEWEYAARSGGRAERWAGVLTESRLGDYAWHGGNSGSETHDVGRKRPNGLGLYDMAGNVEEYCADPFVLNQAAVVPAATTTPGAAPEAVAAGCHVVRGGSWSHAAWAARNDQRRCIASDRLAGPTVGFRLAADRAPEGEQPRLPAALRFHLLTPP